LTSFQDLEKRPYNRIFLLINVFSLPSSSFLLFRSFKLCFFQWGSILHQRVGLNQSAV
jgi:hypothetical protein